MPLRALRGATTIDVDEVDHLTERMVELFTELFARNGIDHDDVVSIIFPAICYTQFAQHSRFECVFELRVEEGQFSFGNFQGCF